MSVHLRRLCKVLLRRPFSTVKSKFGFPPAPANDRGRSFCSFGIRQYHSHRRADIQVTRPVSTINSLRDVAPAVHATGTTDSEREKLIAVFPDIVRDLTDAASDIGIEETKKWIAKILQYNVPGGKLTRGLTVVHSYRMLTHDNMHTKEHIYLAQIMGWCVEMLQGFFIVLDDIMDKSTTRRGRACWHIHNDIGLMAVNDGILLECGIYSLLKKYFQDKSYYLHVLQLFHDVTFKTTLGQSLDLLTSQAGKKPDYSKFTMDHYSAIVKYKTAYYSFYLPVSLAMHMVGITDLEVHHKIKTILLEMGHFFQVQDDYLDCFGNPEVTGKTGTDIASGKCSWLAVTALQQANDEQQAVFKEYYGSDDEEKVAVIKALYEDLRLQSIYAEYEKRAYESINDQFKQLPNGIPHNLFITFLKIIYRRKS